MYGYTTAISPICEFKSPFLVSVMPFVCSVLQLPEFRLWIFADQQINCLQTFATSAGNELFLSRIVLIYIEVVVERYGYISRKKLDLWV